MPILSIVALIYIFIQLTTFINAQNLIPDTNVPWKAGHAAAFQDPYVIIYGGTTDPIANSTTTIGSNSVWVWNSVNGSWYNAQSLSANNHSQQIYIKAVDLPSAGQTLILASNTSGNSPLLQKIDSNFWAWNNPTSANSPASPVSGYTMTIVNNIIYTYGGISVDGNGQRMSGAVQNNLWTLDANSYSWGSGSNGPAVTDHSTCYVQSCNCLITFGGTQTGDASQPSQTIYVYSLSTQSWNLQVRPNSINGALPGPRRLHTATCLKDKMIVFGGGTTNPFDPDVWVLEVPNANNLTWVHQNVQGQGPGARMGHSAVYDEKKNKIYIYGGWGGNTQDMYILDTSNANQWAWTVAPPTGMPSTTNPSNPPGDGSVPIGAIVGGVVGGVVFIAAIALVAFFFLRRRKQRRNEKVAMEKDIDGQSQDDYYWRFGENVHQQHHRNGSNGNEQYGYEDDYQSYSLSDPNYSNANLMTPYSGNKRMSKALTSKTGTSSTRDSFLRYSDHGGTQSTVMEMVLTPSESNYDNNSFSNIRGSRQSLQASKLLLAHDFDGPGQIPNEYVSQKPNEFSVPTSRFSAHNNSNNNHINVSHYASSTAATDGAPLSSSMEVLRSIKTDGSGSFGQKNIKVTHSYASDSNNSNDINNNNNNHLYHKISDIQSQDENIDDDDESSIRDESTAPIQYIPGASKQFSIATTVTNSAPSQIQYNNNAIPLTHHQYPSSSVPVAQPVSSSSNRNSENYGSVGGGRISVQSYQLSGNNNNHLSQEQQDENLYDTVSPLDRLATLGHTNGIMYEQQQPSGYFPNISEDNDKSMLPPNNYPATSSILTSNPSSETNNDTNNANNSNNSSNNNSKNINNNTTDISHSSSTVTDSTIDTNKSNSHSNSSENNNKSNSNSNSNSNNINQQQQQNCLLVAGMLPRRYQIDKSKSSIIGPVNSILFVHKTDNTDQNNLQSNVVVKSFGRREAWERECRTLIKLKSSQVVTLIEVLTIQDDSHIPTPYYHNEQNTSLTTDTSLPNGDEDADEHIKYLTVMERLDETLSTVIRRARPTSVDMKQTTQWSDQTTKIIAKDIIECLIWCHKNGIAFCDLKPSNIMHNFDEAWKLIDFEASRTIGEECVGVITPRYCPPEVARATTYGLEGANGVVATASVDLWALGCVLYELETKRPLFASNIKDETILHFVSHPSSSTPILNNGLRWNDQKELEIPQLERQIRNEHARQLIKMLLSRDPLKRGSAEQLLNHSYFN